MLVLFTKSWKRVVVVVATAGVTVLVVITAMLSGPKPLAIMAPPATDRLLVKSTVAAAIALRRFGTDSVTMGFTDEVAPTKTWKPFPPLLPVGAPAGMVAVMTMGKPHRVGIEVLAMYGAGQTPAVGNGIGPVSGVEFMLLSSRVVMPPDARIWNVVPAGKVHCPIIALLPTAQPEPFNGVLSNATSNVSVPLPVFQM